MCYTFSLTECTIFLNKRSLRASISITCGLHEKKITFNDVTLREAEVSGRVGAVVLDADGGDAGEQEAGAGVVAAAAAATVGGADARAVADDVALIEKTFIWNVHWKNGRFKIVLTQKLKNLAKL